MFSKKKSVIILAQFKRLKMMSRRLIFAGSLWRWCCFLWQSAGSHFSTPTVALPVKSSVHFKDTMGHVPDPRRAHLDATVLRYAFLPHPIVSPHRCGLLTCRIGTFRQCIPLARCIGTSQCCNNGDTWRSHPVKPRAHIVMLRVSRACFSRTGPVFPPGSVVARSCYTNCMGGLFPSPSSRGRRWPSAAAPGERLGQPETPS